MDPLSTGASAPGWRLVPLLAAGLIVAEFLSLRLRQVRTASAPAYDHRQALLSIAIFLGGRIVGALTAGAALVPFAELHRHRLFDIPTNTAWSVLLLFVAVEFCYYWHHRAMHVVNVLWATHSVHHSTAQLNLTAALRLGWGGHLTGGLLFYLPLAGIGFPPAAILGMVGVILAYQFLLHVSVPISLGPLGAVINTPALHHVHHASNRSCHDKNFGAVFVVFDRLFGTYRPLLGTDVLRYGLAPGGAADTGASLAILYAGWLAIFRRLRRAPSWPVRLGVLFGRPNDP